ncbi:MAG: hypothetical protein LDL26_05675, partial [Caenispirillum bisanense]|nr:hypothetical protein [Caenispirillum bisanense]MCA1973545.1 hypothetical protein [Caenispirillum sp.]
MAQDGDVFRDMMDRLPQPIVVAAAEGAVLWANGAARALLAAVSDPPPACVLEMAAPEARDDLAALL